jgi:hypothetical protein
VPWVIGIDEAGYGPNLGPFVMSAVACRVPDDLTECDLWHVLRAAVRRLGTPADGRLLIEDSKLVYSPNRGLHNLETAVLAAWPPGANGSALSLRHYLSWLSPTYHADLVQEPWYSGASVLPLVAPTDEVARAAARFAEACGDAQVFWNPCRSVLLCPARFNQLLDQWNTKGAVLGHALAQLLGEVPALPGSDPVVLFIDKHGGRNRYAALLQHALPHGCVVAHQESSERSVYSVQGLGRDIRLVIQPRADVEHFCVALASLVSKYLREVFMHEFNRFWQAHVPQLKQTAGYPGDAARFFDAIRPTVQRLGLAESAVWRRK